MNRYTIMKQVQSASAKKIQWPQARDRQKIPEVRSTYLKLRYFKTVPRVYLEGLVRVGIPVSLATHGDCVRSKVVCFSRLDCLSNLKYSG